MSPAAGKPLQETHSAAPAASIHIKADLNAKAAVERKQVSLSCLSCRFQQLQVSVLELAVLSGILLDTDAPWHCLLDRENQLKLTHINFSLCFMCFPHKHKQRSNFY